MLPDDMATLAEEKFHGLLEAAPDAMVIVDGEGRVVLVNSQAERLFGYARAEILNAPVEKLLPASLRDAHQTYRRSYFTDPHVRPMGQGLTLSGRRRDGSEFPVDISLCPLRTEKGIWVTAAIRDITDRQRIERELRDQNLALERAVEVKDRFLGSLSHELRTPLNAILGFTGTLLMRLPGPLNADQERQLATIQASARQLLSLINNLLDLAKIDSGKVELRREPTDVRAVVERVAAALRPVTVDKGLELAVDLPAEAVVVSTDPHVLGQILHHLAHNALRFTDRGTVRLALADGAAGGERRTEFRVIDSGPGLPAEERARLFQAFSQGSDPVRRHEGSGLGLHLSQKLAALLGGEITVESEPGVGSTFTLSIRELPGS